MANSLIQPSFAAGELSPNLYARVDLAKFHIGAATLLNAYVDYRGGITTRPGTRYVASAGQALGANIRLVKFQFSVLQTYVLEFGDGYMRVIKNGGLVLGAGGLPYRLVTPWAAADLPLLKFAQSNDVMTFTHPSYPIYDLARLAEDNWQLSVVDFGVAVSPPINPIASVDPATTETSTLYTYVVTSIDAGGNESQASTVTGIGANSFTSREQTITISWPAVGGASYYNVYKATPKHLTPGGPTDYVSAAQYGFITSTQGVQAVDSNILPNYAKTPPLHRNPFAIRAVNTFNIAAGGGGYRNTDSVGIADPTGNGFVGRLILANGAVSGVQVINGGQGYTNPSVVIFSPTGSGASIQAGTGVADGVYPGVVTYFQQRKTFAASARFPSTYWMTQPGSFNNMDTSLPVGDGNALTFTLAALEQNPIKYMIPVQNGLVMLTGGAAWLVSGGDNNSAITPNSVKQTPQVYNGCADVLPLVVGTNLLYIQEKGYVVQDLKYDFFSNIYTGEDRTYLSSHLFEGRTVRDWCWSEQPQKLVWAVMSDGQLLTMTYIKEQEVFGWARHTTNGAVRAICCIPEGDEDVVYMAVEREFGLAIERLSTRRFTSMLDAWTLDCALRYQGPAVSVVGGLPMDPGVSVTALIDGVPYPGLVMGAGGTLLLPVAGSNILVGFGYETRFASLYLDAGDPTVQGKRKNISALTLRLIGARGIWAGKNETALVPVKGDEASPSTLFSKDERVVLAGGWNTQGQVFLQGMEGCPWTLTAVIPEVTVGDSRG